MPSHTSALRQTRGPRKIAAEPSESESSSPEPCSDTWSDRRNRCRGHGNCAVPGPRMLRGASNMARDLARDVQNMGSNRVVRPPPNKRKGPSTERVITSLNAPKFLYEGKLRKTTPLTDTLETCTIGVAGSGLAMVPEIALSAGGYWKTRRSPGTPGFLTRSSSPALTVRPLAAASGVPGPTGAIRPNSEPTAVVSSAHFDSAVGVVCPAVSPHAFRRTHAESGATRPGRRTGRPRVNRRTTPR